MEILRPFQELDPTQLNLRVDVNSQMVAMEHIKAESDALYLSLPERLYIYPGEYKHINTHYQFKELSHLLVDFLSNGCQDTQQPLRSFKHWLDDCGGLSITIFNTSEDKVVVIPKNTFCIRVQILQIASLNRIDVKSTQPCKKLAR